MYRSGAIRPKPQQRPQGKNKYGGTVAAITRQRYNININWLHRAKLNPIYMLILKELFNSKK
jgi:hypothetical protein